MQKKSFIAQAQDFDANKTDKEIVVKFGRQWPRRHDTQHNDTQHNDIPHNDTL